MLEVFIGGWKNSKSVIRKNRSKPDVAEVDTADILSGDEFRDFWIRWDANVVSVGKGGEGAPFLTYENSDNLTVNFIGICTGWGSSGSWVVDAPVYDAPSSTGGNAVWVAASSTSIPDGAYEAGQDSGEPLIVGRARHEGALIPGKVVRSHGVCYVAWGGGEHGKDEFEVLMGGGNWVEVSGGNIPSDALPAGKKNSFNNFQIN